MSFVKLCDADACEHGSCMGRLIVDSASSLHDRCVHGYPTSLETIQIPREREHDGMDLTDEDIWHLVCAPFSTSSRELAIAHGLSLTQVMRIRLHYRREPWTCPVW